MKSRSAHTMYFKWKKKKSCFSCKFLHIPLRDQKYVDTCSCGPSFTLLSQSWRHMIAYKVFQCCSIIFSWELRGLIQTCSSMTTLSKVPAQRALTSTPIEHVWDDLGCRLHSRPLPRRVEGGGSTIFMLCGTGPSTVTYEYHGRVSTYFWSQSVHVDILYI